MLRRLRSQAALGIHRESSGWVLRPIQPQRYQQPSLGWEVRVEPTLHGHVLGIVPQFLLCFSLKLWLVGRAYGFDSKGTDLIPLCQSGGREFLCEEGCHVFDFLSLLPLSCLVPFFLYLFLCCTCCGGSFSLFIINHSSLSGFQCRKGTAEDRT